MPNPASNSTTVGVDRRSLLIAVAAPSAVVAADLLTNDYNVWSDALRVDALSFALLVALKIAFLAWAVGRGVARPVLRVVVFVWAVALVDLGVYVRYVSTSFDSASTAAIVLAQAGMLVFWSILSEIRWVWRLPIACLSIAAILPVAFHPDTGWSYDAWPLLLTVSLLGLGVACVALRWRGWRLADVAASRDRTEVVGVRRASQFGVVHMLLWSSALAPLFALLRVNSEMMVRSLGSFGVFGSELLYVLTISTLMTLGCLVVIWVVLGGARLWLRLLVAAVFFAAISAPLINWSAEIWGRARTTNWYPAWRSIDNLLHDMHEYWPCWMVLAYGSLAALLLFLRTSGQRLRRGAPAE
ncbi:hypothetical protein Mal64_23810 [Pseudobythopirellula maris]|uniref:Uncharacterized protein n=1 Tax=Pseudobythopirellula maris TaxID=2527991 RepID=A0A5C5ZQ05_9BACT|nr:hypothetical protein [Pseudobythopirellula maris]TWT88891.1 hypothetical protein Mal64_23810 [Pseudobythopirellula maris]